MRSIVDMDATRFFLNEALDRVRIPVFSTSPELQVLKEHGVCVIKAAYSQKACDEIRAEIDQLLRELPSSDVQKVEGDQRIYCAEQKSKNIFSFNQDKKFFLSGETYLGRRLTCVTLAAKIEFSPENKGSGGGWHRDSFSRQYKAILYLCDVCADNGPFEYVLGSHGIPSILDAEKSLSRSGYRNLRYTQDEIDKVVQECQLQKQLFLGKAGDVLLVDTRGLHRGSPLRSGERYALTNYYFTPRQFRRTSIINDSLKSKYLGVHPEKE